MKSCLFIFLFLLSPTALFSQVRISEFMASNNMTLEDEDGDDEDWIEVINTSDAVVNLEGWGLSDDDGDLFKWRFPDVNLNPGQQLIVFASNKNRVFPGSQLHTNFSLKKGGEYLALTTPAGTTTSEFSPEYPVQVEDVSYGFDQNSSDSTAVTSGDPVTYGVPSSQAQFNASFTNWNTAITGNFSTLPWKSANIGLGYERSVADTYGPLIDPAGDIEADLYNQNTSVFVRIPFTLTDASEITSMQLSMRWDDGFVAYINGQKVAENLQPASLTWNSAATTKRDDFLNDETVDFPIDLTTVTLNEGSNLLAIHGLNEVITSSDFLLNPVLNVQRSGALSTSASYFINPTPGGANGIGEAVLAPVFGDVLETPDIKPVGGSGSAPIIATAEVIETTNSIQDVRVYFRVGFGSESSLAMFDNGLNGDAFAGDGIYSASIPTTQLNDGEMLRWRYEVRDTQSNNRRKPAFLDPNDSDRYFGTVAQDPSLATSLLPVLHTFIQSTSLVDTRGGTRGAVYYLGHFYDNVQMDLHGQSTAAFPKKSYDLDFNRGNRFLWKNGENKVKDINLLTNWADKSKMRNTLAYSLFKRAGVSHHFAFPVRVQRNGQFFSVADMVEDGDDRYLERLGLDGDGALYKMYDRIENTALAVKKTRREEGKQDLATLINQLRRNQSTAALRRNAYDHIDLAATVNYLASYAVFGVTDFGHKNFYLYRDTNGSGEWSPMVWDVDLSFGRRFSRTRGYFDDTLYTNIGIFESNNLWSLIYKTPEYLDMFTRRIETLRREILQPSATPLAQDILTNEINDLMDQLDPPGVPSGQSDADQDYANWFNPGNSNPGWGNRFTMRQAGRRLIQSDNGGPSFITALRDSRFVSNYNVAGTSTPIPTTQPSLPDIRIETVDFNPASSNQLEEYIVIRNFESTSIDLSGFTISGGIDYTFPPGTVILSGNGTAASGYRGALYLAKDAAAFRSRLTGPSGGQFRYVQGGYKGQLSARGETLILNTPNNLLVDTFSFSGNATQAQNTLRITEINYHPEDPTTTELASIPNLRSEDFEYIEILNTGSTGLSLDGISLTDGIEFTFPASASLAAGERAIVAKLPAAFPLRYTFTGQVFGPYLGQLANSDDSFVLQDRGENVLTVEYEDDWYPDSDGGGRTLVLRSNSISHTEFDNSGAWGSSLDAGGSPGFAGSGFGTHFNGWQESRYARELREEGQPGHPDADTDNDGYNLWQEYAFGMDPNTADQPVTEGEFVNTVNGPRYTLNLQRRKNAVDASYELQRSPTLTGFASFASSSIDSSTTQADNLENIRFMDNDNMDGRMFYRVSVSQIAP